MKKYTIKPTKKQLKIMKEYWAYLKERENKLLKEIDLAEKQMSKDTGIDDLEFFESDCGFVGIGNYSRTMPLIQQDELEK